MARKQGTPENPVAEAGTLLDQFDEILSRLCQLHENATPEQQEEIVLQLEARLSHYGYVPRDGLYDYVMHEYLSLVFEKQNRRKPRSAVERDEAILRLRREDPKRWSLEKLRRRFQLRSREHVNRIVQKHNKPYEQDGFIIDPSIVPLEWPTKEV